MELLLWIVAVLFVVAGVFRLVVGDWVIGLILIVVGLLIGPGGVSIFT